MDNSLIADCVYLFVLNLFLFFCFFWKMRNKMEIVSINPVDNLIFKLSFKIAWKIAIPFLIIFIGLLGFGIYKTVEILNKINAFGDSSIILITCYSIYSIYLISEILVLKITKIIMKVKKNHDY